MEYRDDDTSAAACPVCGRSLSNLQVSGMGYCEQHGYVAAEWREAWTDDDDEEDDRAGDS